MSSTYEYFKKHGFLKDHKGFMYYADLDSNVDFRFAVSEAYEEFIKLSSSTSIKFLKTMNEFILNIHRIKTHNKILIEVELRKLGIISINYGEFNLRSPNAYVSPLASTVENNVHMCIQRINSFIYTVENMLDHKKIDYDFMYNKLYDKDILKCPRSTINYSNNKIIYYNNISNNTCILNTFSKRVYCRKSKLPNNIADKCNVSSIMSNILEFMLNSNRGSSSIREDTGICSISAELKTDTWVFSLHIKDYLSYSSICKSKVSRYTIEVFLQFISYAYAITSNLSHLENYKNTHISMSNTDLFSMTNTGIFNEDSIKIVNSVLHINLASRLLERTSIRGIIDSIECLSTVESCNSSSTLLKLYLLTHEVMHNKVYVKNNMVDFYVSNIGDSEYIENICCINNAVHMLSKEEKDKLKVYL